MTEQKPATITIDNDDLVHLGGSAPAIPKWVIECSNLVAQYMNERTDGNWAIGGIQKRQG